MVTGTVANAHAIPSGLLLFAGMQPHFIATFSLFCGILLLWTIAVGKILEKICGLPVIAGRIIAGLLLGPSFLSISSWDIFASPLFPFGSREEVNLGEEAKLTMVFQRSALSGIQSVSSVPPSTITSSFS